MAHSAFTITRNWPSIAAAVLVLVATLGTLLAVAFRAEFGSGLSAADFAAIRFTLLQSLTSAAVSTALAIPVARALARRSFPGRGALITLLGAPFLLPVIVAVFGLLAVFGRNGVLSNALGWFGLPPISIYGFHGVVLVHVFFNLPLAIRLILQGWLAIPAERFRLAEQLGAPIGKFLERPMLRAVLPGTFLVIFLICLTSFAVALILGGGPKATTIELAIYQALRFDFDLGRAALLACLQFGFCAIAAMVAWKITIADSFGSGLGRTVKRWDTNGRFSHTFDAGLISLAALFLLLPLTLIVVRGIPGLTEMPTAIWAAALRSVTVAICSAALCVTMALALALRGGMLVSVIGVLPLSASGLVIGTGAFLMIYPFVSPAKLALLVTALVNAVLALPFALRAIAPAVEQAESNFGRLADSLNLQGWARMRLLILPRIRRPLGFAAGLAAALSMGDLGVITLFAGDGQATLPLAMFRLMGAYQMTAAAGAGLVLLGLSLAIFWICDRGGRRDADAD